MDGLRSRIYGGEIDSAAVASRGRRRRLPVLLSVDSAAGFSLRLDHPTLSHHQSSANSLNRNTLAGRRNPVHAPVVAPGDGPTTPESVQLQDSWALNSSVPLETRLLTEPKCCVLVLSLLLQIDRPPSAVNISLKALKLKVERGEDGRWEYEDSAGEGEGRGVYRGRGSPHPHGTCLASSVHLCVSSFQPRGE
ncbi:hypothetical protein COCON_G00080460 [Conger conger]|uniref:Teneurin N-terminal domain-containing protein n=1 Tax=Conger conger TaxID=82655 RepID=A0A9Q1DPK4_CONCO|nr:hypothetical protein COCON_G00080460 [Conger conger]